MITYPWLEASWIQLQKQYQQGYLPQALILNGVKGLGKQLLGEKIAQLILCDEPLNGACKKCRQCHLFEMKGHPDYFIIEPEESSHIIKIEQIRELIDKLNQTPLVATSQVVLINPLESMTLKAANALLKTLEEPLGNVFFILISHRLTQVPVTILSRCQLLPLHVYRSEQTLQWLSKENSCTSEQAEVLLRLSHGAPLEALALAKKNIIAIRNKLLMIMSYTITGVNPLPEIEVLLKENSDDVFRLLRLVLQDVQKCQLGVDASKWVNVDSVKELQQLSIVITPDQLWFQMEALERIEKVLAAGIHINPQIALESIIFKELK